MTYEKLKKTPHTDILTSVYDQVVRLGIWTRNILQTFAFIKILHTVLPSLSFLTSPPHV
jgi:hypothetical protein